MQYSCRQQAVFGGSDTWNNLSGATGPMCKESRHFSAVSEGQILENVTDFTLILNVISHLADIGRV